MAHAGEVEIVDAHLHLINLTDLVYPWIKSRMPALTALLPNLACEFGAVDGVAEAVRVQGCADRVVFQTPFIAAVQLESDDLPSFLARYRDLRIVRAIGKWMAVSIFGARRCMFATHYPVVHLLWDSQTIVSTIQATLGDLSSGCIGVLHRVRAAFDLSSALRRPIAWVQTLALLVRQSPWRRESLGLRLGVACHPLAERNEWILMPTRHRVCQLPQLHGEPVQVLAQRLDTHTTVPPNIRNERPFIRISWTGGGMRTDALDAPPATSVSPIAQVRKLAFPVNALRIRQTSG